MKFNTSVIGARNIFTGIANVTITYTQSYGNGRGAVKKGVSFGGHYTIEFPDDQKEEVIQEIIRRKNALPVGTYSQAKAAYTRVVKTIQKL